MLVLALIAMPARADAIDEGHWAASFGVAGVGASSRVPGEGLLKPMEAEGLTIRAGPNGTQMLHADPLKTGRVRVLVRGPDGLPLKDHPVELEPMACRDTQWFLRLSGKTDAAGRFTVPLAAALQCLRVSSPGIGIGQTGTFELRRQATLDVPLPPLAAFASVEGNLDPAVAPSPGIIVCYSGYALYRRVDTDKSGHFVMHDLPPGPCTLQYASHDHAQHAIAGADLRSGQTVHLSLVSDNDVYAPPAATAPVDAAKEHVLSPLVQGTVRTIGGQPAGGVVVSAVSAVGDVIGTAVTDATGNYHLRYEGTGERDCFVVIRREGHATRIVPRILGATAGGQAPVLDWVLPGPGGTLEIQINRDGRPAAGLDVALYPADIWRTRGTSWMMDPDVDHLNRQLFPAQNTDASGTVRFTDLQAGSYDVAISTRESYYDPQWIEGIRVPENRVTKVTALARATFGNLPVRFFLPDGRRLFDTMVDWWEPATSASTGDYWERLSSSTDLFHQPWRKTGLMVLHHRFRDTPDPVRVYAVTEPFYQGVATLAASWLLPHPRPVDVTMSRHNPGSLTVELRGADGRPAHGTVLAPSAFGDFGRGATSDASGRVTFEAMPAADYPVDVQMDGLASPPDLSLSQADAAYTGISVAPVHTVRVVADQHSELVVQPQMVGYVRGTVIPAPGHSTEEYEVVHRFVDRRFLATDGSPLAYQGSGDVLLDSKSGQFIVGPLTPGIEKFTLVRKGLKEGATFAAGEAAVEVQPGRVAHVALRAAKVTGDEPYRSWPYYDSGDAAVVLADGKTPAVGARVEVFVPDMWWPYMTGVADSSGRAAMTGGTSNGREPHFQPPGSPDRPVVVAWLPATCGATVVPIASSPKGVRLVLPSPISCRGRVTVGGKAPDRLEAVIHVLAAHENAGKLERAMDIRTTCSADGTFELPGLTPGKYRVQAALDDVWLSKSIEFDAREHAALPAIALDIAPPGVPVSIQLHGPKWPQSPAPQVTIERPPGPLTERLWPHSFEADGAGIVYLEGLEAGSHALVLPGGRRQVFEVPPSDDNHRLPVSVEATLPEKR